MSIDAITAKIISDATEYADGLINDANIEADNIIAAAMREAEMIDKKYVAKGVKDTSSIINKINAAAELEARKIRLAVKQQELTATLEAAMDEIADMDPKAYIAFLANRISETGIKEGELLLNAKDRKSIGIKLIKAAIESQKGGKLILSAGTIDAKGGFVIKSGNIEIDSTLETIVNTLKDKIALKIVTALFQA